MITCKEAGYCLRPYTPCSPRCKEYDPTMQEDEMKELTFGETFKFIAVLLVCSAVFGVVAGYVLGVL